MNTTQVTASADKNGTKATAAAPRVALYSKAYPDLRAGDIVQFYGGRFLVTADPVESMAHRPDGYWPAAGVGPSACTVANSVCIEGEVPGYFEPGSTWRFQGNRLARAMVERSGS